MPWKPEDALKHTKKADTPDEQQRWAATANSVLKSSGSDALAIRIANKTMLKPKHKTEAQESESKSQVKKDARKKKY